MRLRNTSEEPVRLPLVRWVHREGGGQLDASLTLDPGEVTDELDVIREQCLPVGANVDEALVQSWLTRFPQIERVLLRSRYERIDTFDEETGLWLPRR